jgi:hypothetical protein
MLKLKQKKMGRPPVPKSKYRGKFFSLRLRPDEQREVEAAVTRSGKSKSDWLRDVLLAAARGGLER